MVVNRFVLLKETQETQISPFPLCGLGALNGRHGAQGATDPYNPIWRWTCELREARCAPLTRRRVRHVDEILRLSLIHI